MESNSGATSFDIISSLTLNGVEHLAEKIFLYLDADSLKNAELVCSEWN